MTVRVAFLNSTSLTGFVAIPHREIWNYSNLAQNAWGDKGEDHRLSIRNGSDQTLIPPRSWPPGG